jgi:capsular exopolysaccharide synthesis family protein
MSRIYDALKKAEQENNSHPATREDISSQSLFEPTEMPAPAAVPLDAAQTPVALEIQPTILESCEDTWPSGSDSVPAQRLNTDWLTACPRSAWTPSPRLISFSDRRHGAIGAEQFRRLRSRLYQLREKQELKRILVSSSIPGEGKTFVCANLAHALARHGGTRVLLIDADLRKPSLHAELGAAAAPGLSEYLQGSVDEFAIVQRGSIENLFFIAGGSITANPADMFSSSRFRVLMEHAAGLFDWVIVDSSPVVPVSDATVVAQHCDGVLLVVKAEATPFDLAQKAKEEFRDAVLIGVVLNHVTDFSAYTPYYYSTYKGAATSEPAKVTE